LSPLDQLLGHLGPLGFEVGKTLAPFDQELPLVGGWALHRRTATFALFATSDEGFDDTAWRDLLFALSGLRNDIRSGRDPALSSPILFALIGTPDDGDRLRALVEELARDYLLFTRLEINIVIGDLAQRDLDLELAPLLPRCRRAVDQADVLGPEVLNTLERYVREEVVRRSQESPEPALVEEIREAAEEIADRLAIAVGAKRSDADPAVSPVNQLSVRDLRSFRKATIDLQALTVLVGGNGSGKSTLVEALQILWTGTSSRWPNDVDAQEFQRHLVRGESDAFVIQGVLEDGTEREAVLGAMPSRDRAARNFFLHDLTHDVALEEPTQRYKDLLELTGLQIPALDAEAARVKQDAKDDLNRLLVRLDLEPLARRGNRGVKHVRDQLTRHAVAPPPDGADVSHAARRVEDVAAGQGLRFAFPLDLSTSDRHIAARLASWSTELAESLRVPDGAESGLRALHAELSARAEYARGYLGTLESLLAQVDLGNRAEEKAVAPPQEASSSPEPLPLQTPVIDVWLALERSLRAHVSALAAGATDTEDKLWRARLDEFVANARQLIDAVPVEELSRMRDAIDVSAPPKSVELAQRRSLSPSLLGAAGFMQSAATLPQLDSELTDALAQLRDRLRAYAAGVRESADSVLRSPSLGLGDVETDLRLALARYEVARAIEKPIVVDLISTSFGNIVAELISALTRFEWYFTPVGFDLSNGRLGMHGMVKEGPSYDVRMLLNAGERSIVTFSWFLALYLLQPEEHRRVLALDDPFANLDANNQAAAISTLRMFLRLVRPDQVVFSCHDQMLAEGVLHEMGEVEDWPLGRTYLRLQRSPKGFSESASINFPAAAPDLDDEIAHLGLSEGARVP
jgi:energy-coupling factor transporter ATP-binding protein EcfA2